MADILSGLGGLGGLMKGLTSIMPQDEPATQYLRLQGEVSDLQKQEKDLYVQIGQMAVEQYGLESFGEIADKMRLTQANLAAAQQKLNAAKAEAEEKERLKKEALAGRTCSQCGHENPEGTKFCQECGSKLGVQNLCPACGAANAPGVKFCQECGSRLQAEEPTSVFCSSCGKENPAGTRFCGDCGERLEG
ncbi:MAG: zinc ribbon domain-containing protein [Lachnospiraceae bacterium]|nr:zinc ribbon domain-containing protein [Lachnospiraceae bacterium]